MHEIKSLMLYRLRKLPNPSDNELADSHTHTKNNQPTIQPYTRHRTANATDDLPSIHCTSTANHADRADRHLPLVKTTDTNKDSQSVNVCTPSDLDISNSPELASQSTDATAAEAVATRSATKPLPLPAGCPSRIHRHPSRYL